MKLRLIQKITVILLVFLFIASTIGVVANGEGIGLASLYSFMNILGSPLVISEKLIDAPNPIMLLVQLFGVIGNLALTILLTTMFYESLSSVDIVYKFRKRGLNRLKDHIIITPANSLAIELARKLKQNELVPVILDKDISKVRGIDEKGMLAVDGDPTQTGSLKEIGLDKAAVLILLGDSDIDNMLIVITAKLVNKRIRIVSRVKRIEDIPRLERSGVSKIIMLETAVGTELGKFVLENSM